MLCGWEVKAVMACLQVTLCVAIPERFGNAIVFKCVLQMSRFFSPRKGGSMFLPPIFYLSVCLSVYVCLSVTTITKKIVDGFVLNFMGRFLCGKKRSSSCFVTIGRGMWKYTVKNSVNRRLFTFIVGVANVAKC